MSDEPFREEIGVAQAFRPAASGGPEGPHYIRPDFFQALSAARAATELMADR